MNKPLKSLTVTQLIKALELCEPNDTVEFIGLDGNELKIVFVEKSSQRDTVYLRSETPSLNDADGASMIIASPEIPYLGDAIKWEDEANE